MRASRANLPDLHIALTPITGFIPLEPSLDSGAGETAMLEQVKSHADNLLLHRNVIRPAAGIAKRKIGKDKARDPTLLYNVTGGAENNGRDAVGFEMTGDQSDRLVADRSQGD